MSNHRIKAGVLITALIVVMFAIATVPPINEVGPSVPTGKAQFVLASWDYPDEYGQGIEMFAFYENSTGAWLSYGDVYEHDQSYIVEWNVSLFIKLRCYTFFNSTFAGAIDTTDGQNYQRHNVTVTGEGKIVFSKQNFTYYSVSDILDPMWYYGYEVVLNFIPQFMHYRVTVTYEIYW